MQSRFQLLLPRRVDALADDGDARLALGQRHHLLRRGHRERGAIEGIGDGGRGEILRLASLAQDDTGGGRLDCGKGAGVEKGAEGGDVGWGGATAAADNGSAGVQDRFHGPGKLVGSHIEDRFAVLDARQSGVALGHDEGAVVRRKLFHERRQLHGPQRAVEPHGRGAQSRQRRGGDGRRRAEEGPAVLAEGHGGEHRQRRAFHRSEHGSLGFQQVGHGFHDDEIAARRLGGAGLFGEDIEGLVEGEGAQRLEQGAGRSDVAGHERRSGRPRVGRSRRVHLGHRGIGARELQAVGAEGVGGDAVGAGFHVLALDGHDGLRMREVQQVRHLVDGMEASGLNKRAHAAVEQQVGAPGQSLGQAVVGHGELTRGCHSRSFLGHAGRMNRQQDKWSSALLPGRNLARGTGR